MTTFNFNYLNNYTNHGQNAEQSIRFALTGKIEKADNLAHNLGTDCLTYQIKSARASVCKGTNIEEYLADDKASEYIYGTKEGVAYVMSREEYIAFVKEFGTTTRESGKNGGTEKIRLKHETSAMLDYLAERVAQTLFYVHGAGRIFARAGIVKKLTSKKIKKFLKNT